MKKYIEKKIYLLGSKLRNPNLKSLYIQLKSSEFKSRCELDNIQNEKLSELAIHCYLYSDYYKELFSSININPISNTFTFEELAKLPILSKNTLLSENERIHTVNKFKFKKLFFCETSGSTGQALTFYRDEEWDSYNRASIQRGLSWYGLSPWDKSGYFWGFNFSLLQSFKVKLLDILVNRFRLFSYSQKDLNKFLKNCNKAMYLEGYSSMIYEAAKMANEKSINIPNLKLIKGTSEKIYPHYHEAAIKAFGSKIVSEYGSAESGIIAFECPEGSMHINEETCYVEIFNGRAIITNLVAKSFPTLRYDLGDYIKLSDSRCSCGRAHRVIEEVTGRVGKSIIGKDGEKFPSLTLYYVFKNLALNSEFELSYRCVQSEVGSLKIYLEVEVTQQLKKLLDKEFNKYFNGKIQCDYRYVESVKEKGKKLKDFESFLH